MKRLILLGMLGTALSQAGVFYSYTGQAFSAFDGAYSCPSECRFTGWFTVSAPLISLHDTQITPDAFSFTDGGTTWNSVCCWPAHAAAYAPATGFVVSTDALGDITTWDIGGYLYQGVSYGIFRTSSQPWSNGPPQTLLFTPKIDCFDCTEQNISQPDGDYAASAGIWSAAATPEPASLALGLLGVALLAILRLRARWQAILPLISLFAGLSQAGVLDGLVAAYPFDGNANDATGHGYNLTLFGNPTFVPGRFGEALSLDGTGNQYASRLVDDAVFNLGGSADFTIQVWVNFASRNPGEQTLIEKFAGAGGPGWTLTTPGPSLQFYEDGPRGGGFNWADGVWYDVVARNQAGTLDLFVNGSLVATAGLGPGDSTTNPLLIGRRDAGDGRNFAVNGLLDDVAIWDRALSDQEVAQLQTEQVAPEPGTLIMLGGGLALVAWRARRPARSRRQPAA